MDIDFIAMVASYSFDVKNIDIWALPFFKHNNSFIATVAWASHAFLVLFFSIFTLKLTFCQTYHVIIGIKLVGIFSNKLFCLFVKILDIFRYS